MATALKTSRRVVGMRLATYFEPGPDFNGQPTTRALTAEQGDEIELLPGEEERLDGLGALLPKGMTPKDAAERAQALLDAYRGERGDQEAMDRHVRRQVVAGPSDGGIVDVSAPVDAGAGVEKLGAWITEHKPTVDDTVALAEGDPVKAARLLEAEGVATDGSPRPGVVAGLRKIG